MARSIETNIAIDKIWKSFDKKQMLEGFEILQQASKNGDADACCFLGRCYMGEEFVWDGAGFPVDEQLASQLIKQSVLYGSADGVMCALRTGNLSPAVRKEMPFASLSDAFDMVKANAQAGDAFSQYEMGNAMFYGDYLTIYGKSESDKFSSEEQYNAFAYPIAAKYYAESFKNGLSAAFGNYRSIYFSELAEISTRDFEAEMKRLADYGDPRVCNDYGKWLDDQYNDKKSAFRYYVMALEQGDLQSAYNVAVCYAT
ncbi:MAG: hypothetical protein K2O88_02850, partial [Paramuribaculum sp.]|nr:hypothetical protein [Paramuribaculum sp.]